MVPTRSRRLRSPDARPTTFLGNDEGQVRRGFGGAAASRDVCGPDLRPGLRCGLVGRVRVARRDDDPRPLDRRGGHRSPIPPTLAQSAQLIRLRRPGLRGRSALQHRQHALTARPAGGVEPIPGFFGRGYAATGSGRRWTQDRREIEEQVLHRGDALEERARRRAKRCNDVVFDLEGVGERDAWQTRGGADHVVVKEGVERDRGDRAREVLEVAQRVHLTARVVRMCEVMVAAVLPASPRLAQPLRLDAVAYRGARRRIDEFKIEVAPRPLLVRCQHGDRQPGQL